LCSLEIFWMMVAVRISLFFISNVCIFFHLYSLKWNKASKNKFCYVFKNRIEILKGPVFLYKNSRHRQIVNIFDSQNFLNFFWRNLLCWSFGSKKKSLKIFCCPISSDVNPFFRSWCWFRNVWKFGIWKMLFRSIS